jgi:hypothetical protein
MNLSEDWNEQNRCEWIIRGYRPLHHLFILSNTLRIAAGMRMFNSIAFRLSISSRRSGRQIYPNSCRYILMAKAIDYPAEERFA